MCMCEHVYEYVYGYFSVSTLRICVYLYAAYVYECVHGESLNKKLIKAPTPQPLSTQKTRANNQINNHPPPIFGGAPNHPPK